MGIVRVIVIALIIIFVSRLVRYFLASKNTSGWKLPGRKPKDDFISEELYKLNELRRRGIITEEEFQQQKKKLLNR